MSFLVRRRGERSTDIVELEDRGDAWFVHGQIIHSSRFSFDNLPLVIGKGELVNRLKDGRWEFISIPKASERN